MFPNLSNIPENADIFSSMQFAGDGGDNGDDSMAFSIQADTTNMAQPTVGTIVVYGSNKPMASAADGVAVKDETGSASATALNSAFVKDYFPYKYIGVKYLHGANSGAGTLSIMMEQKCQRVNIA